MPVRGEIDFRTAPSLRSDLHAVIDTYDGDLVADCAAMSFIDSSGVSAFVEADQLLHTRGDRLRLVNVAGAPQRKLAAFGLDYLVSDEDDPPR